METETHAHAQAHAHAKTHLEVCAVHQPGGEQWVPLQQAAHTGQPLAALPAEEAPDVGRGHLLAPPLVEGATQQQRVSHAHVAVVPGCNAIQREARVRNSGGEELVSTLARAVRAIRGQRKREEHPTASNQSA